MTVPKSPKTTLKGGNPPASIAPLSRLRVALPPLQYALERSETIKVGSGPPSEFIIGLSGISKAHAELTFDRQSPQEIRVADLKSSNGTKINGRPVAQPWSSAFAGDEITLDGVRILVMDQWMDRECEPLHIPLGIAPLRQDLAHRILMAAARGHHLVVVGPKDRRVSRITAGFHRASSRSERELLSAMDIDVVRDDRFFARARGCTVVVDGLAAGDLPRSVLEALAGGTYHIGLVIWLDEGAERRAELTQIWGEHLTGRGEIRVPSLIHRMIEGEAEDLFDRLFAEMASGTSELCRGGPARRIGKDRAKQLTKIQWTDDFDSLEAFAHFLFHYLELRSERAAERCVLAEAKHGIKPMPRTTFRNRLDVAGIAVAGAVE